MPDAQFKAGYNLAIQDIRRAMYQVLRPPVTSYISVLLDNVLDNFNRGQPAPAAFPGSAGTASAAAPYSETRAGEIVAASKEAGPQAITLRIGSKRLRAEVFPDDFNSGSDAAPHGPDSTGEVDEDDDSENAEPSASAVAFRPANLPSEAQSSTPATECTLDPAAPSIWAAASKAIGMTKSATKGRFLSGDLTVSGRKVYTVLRDPPCNQCVTRGRGGEGCHPCRVIDPSRETLLRGKKCQFCTRNGKKCD